MESSLKIQDAGTHIEVVTLRAPYADADNSWDRNWIDVLVRVTAGAFSGSFSACFQTSDFVALAKNLRILHQDLRSSFEFASLEGQLEIKVSGDGLGHILFKCIAINEAGTGNKLLFELETDQSHIPVLISQLDRILEAFPVIE